MANDEKLIFPIGFDLEEGVAQVEKDWGKMQKKLQDTFKSQTIQVDADISKAVLDKLYAKFEGLIKTMESKAPQIKLKIPDTVDFEQEINRLKVQLKSINLGELTDAESKDLYLYIRQLEALAKALKEVNKQEQLRQANNPANKALQEARAQEKLTRAKANDALAEQRRAKIATEAARQNEINNRSAQRSAVIAEQKRAATARAENAELRLTQAKERSTKATHEQNAAYKSQSGYLQRLFQRMVAYASVTQAFSFIRNIREVTAQFELQRVALGSIIGDLNEANAMFEQIKAAAVKSPFQIKELVTYTKQLAAYKIETDELFETTQRLADISAGIGVGMERLVLAYGQIRATGYLRASEVRQLTEAGIPIVEELAKKMSDLRGETVSAAEVMGLISERAISFGMVKEVFDDMTSAGGMFYKMQEKQAETLAGQWSNLQDAISIMYEEIGNTEGVNNSIKGTIGLVKSLAENWRIVASVLGSVAISIGATKLASLFIPTLVVNTKKVAQAEEQLRIATERRIAAQQRGGRVGIWVAKSQEAAARATLNAANATTKFGRAWSMLKGMFKGGGWIGLAVTLVSALATWFISARKEAKRLNEELAKIGTEGALQADQSVRNFERLAKTIRESADGSREQSEALAELKRTYGDLLPTQDKEILSLVKVKEGYEDVTTAIREKINAQIYEQKMNTIISEYGTNLANKQKKPKKWLENMGFSAEETTRIFNAIDKAVQEGLINSQQSVLEQTRTIEKIIKDSTGKVVNLTTQYSSGITNAYKNVYEGQKLTRLALGLRNLVGVYSDFNNSVNELADSQKRASNITWKYQEGYEKLKDSIAKTNARFNESTFAGSESIKANTLAKWREYFISLSDIFAKTPKGGIVDFKALEDEIEKLPANLRTHIRVVQKEYEKLIPTDITRLANDKLQEYAEKVGISMDDVKEHLKTNEQSTEDWAKGLKGAYESAEKKLVEYKKNQEAFSKQGAPFKDWSEDIEETTKEMKVLKLLMDFFKEFLSQSGGGTKQRKSQLSILQEELQLHEKIYAKYKEYRQYKSAEEAKAKVEDYFGDTIDALKFKPSFDKSGYQNVLTQYQGAIEALLAKAKDETERGAIKKVLLDLGFKIDDINWQDEKDKIEKSLKKLSDDLSRTKTAKEFFDRMLGLTGDKQLSATLTMSVYGEGGEDLGTKLAKQTADAFKAKYKGINFSKTAISDKGVFDWDTILAEGKKQKGKFGTSEYDKFLDDVDAGRKASAKRLETLMNELEKTKTYSEKLVDIYTNTQERLNTIDQEVEDDAVRKRLKEQAKELQTKEIQKLQYEAFKDSPMYVAMFENLDATSTAMLTNMRNHIVKLQSEWQKLDPTQLKELQSRINEIDKQLATRNPFKSIVDGIKEFNALQKSGSRKEDEQALFEATKKKVQAEKEYAQAVADGKSEAEIQRLAKALQKCVDAEDKAAKKMSEWDDATQKVMQGMQNLQQVVNLVQTTTTAVNDIVEAFGGWGDAADEEFWNTILDGINGLMSGVQSAGTGVAQIMAGDILGGVTSLVSGIGSIVSSIGNLIYAGRIKRANKEIERQQKLLDNLAYSYERLEKAQEKAFGSDYISNYEQRLANLQAQQEAYLKQAEAERSKGKKADKKKIKEYEEQARETADEIKDMQSELSEYFLGTDLTSAARDFANAWIDAYKEFGSTTDAMKAKFQDMIQNMIVESFAARVIQTALEPIFEEIDDWVNSGFDMGKLAEIANMTHATIGNIDVGMTNLMNALSQAGISVRGMGSDLTGISRDIATASEESILGLAAGINTQNFYISQVPTKLDTIIGLLRGENAMQGSAITLQDLVTIQNQHLSYLPSIAQHTAETVAECKQIVAETRRTADALERVIKPRGTQATHTVNTSL